MASSGGELEAEIRIDAVLRSCIGCHRAFGKFTLSGGDYSIHPVGVPASPLARAGVPRTPVVDVRGTPSPSDDVVACTTCHQVHNGAYPYMLRWAPADAGHACANCHSQGRRSESPDILAAR